MELEELKLFLKQDDYEEDEFIKSLQISAEEYLTNAGVKKDYSRELYKLAIKILVTHWYENRGVETYSKTASKIAFSLSSLITQLKYT